MRPGELSERAHTEPSSQIIFIEHDTMDCGCISYVSIARERLEEIKMISTKLILLQALLGLAVTESARGKVASAIEAYSNLTTWLTSSYPQSQVEM